jgi:hypothetical protein
MSTEFGPTHAKTIEALAEVARARLGEALEDIAPEGNNTMTAEEIGVRFDLYEGLVKLHRESCARDGGVHPDVKVPDSPAGLFGSTEPQQN